MNLKCIQSTIGIAVKTAKNADIEEPVKTLENMLGKIKDTKRRNRYDWTNTYMLTNGFLGVYFRQKLKEL